MKDASENPGNGLARVDSPTPGTPVKSDGPSRRSAPMKRTGETPSAESLVPKPIANTANIEQHLRSVLVPILEEFETSEINTASGIVNSIMPQFVAQRSAQSADNVAFHVSRIGEEVALDVMSQFQGFGQSNAILCDDMGASLVESLLAGSVAK